MADVLVRDVPDEVLARLKAQAAARGHSLQAELHELLLHASGDGLQSAIRLAARMRKSLAGRKHSDSSHGQREDRDR